MKKVAFLFFFAAGILFALVFASHSQAMGSRPQDSPQETVPEEDLSEEEGDGHPILINGCAECLVVSQTLKEDGTGRRHTLAIQGLVTEIFGDTVFLRVSQVVSKRETLAGQGWVADRSRPKPPNVSAGQITVCRPEWTRRGPSTQTRTIRGVPCPATVGKENP